MLKGIKESILSEQLEKFKEQLVEIGNLRSAAALLYWDQATYMPSGGATARGQQIATLNRISLRNSLVTT